MKVEVVKIRTGEEDMAALADVEQDRKGKTGVRSGFYVSILYN